MNTVSTLFQQAQLAEAAYADFTTGDTEQALINAKFSATQAAAFVDTWDVIDHIPDTSSGFSATIFRDRQTGAYSLAIRGSTGIIRDFIEDAAIITRDGLGIDQLVDLYNFWQRANTAPGQEYTAAKFNVITDMETGATSFNITFLLSGQLDNPILKLGSGGIAATLAELSVVGHSLGGHLAMAFTRLFPDIPSNALAVNGLGFKIGNPTVDSIFASPRGQSQHYFYERASIA